MGDAHQIIRTFHSTCMVSDYDAAIRDLAGVAGLRVLEYGENQDIGRRGGMTWIGDNSIEVAQPIVDGHAADRFVRRVGPGMHSYALQVADLDVTLARLQTGGVTVGVRPAEGFCFTDPRTSGGLLFEWSNFTVEEDPRIGAPYPDYRGTPVLDVRTHAFVGAVHPEPLQWADTFGPLFGLEEAFRDEGATAGDPVVGLAAPDCVIALYRLDPAVSSELWGQDHTRARFHVLGLGVDDLDEAHWALEANGIGEIRRTDGQIVLDPAATGEVPVVLVANLHPGDPRLGS